VVDMILRSAIVAVNRESEEASSELSMRRDGQFQVDSYDRRS